MNSVYLVILGLLLGYLGVTGRIEGVYRALINPVKGAGYSVIPPGQFVLGAFGVTLPLLAMEDRPDWQKSYILLILVGMAIVNYKGLERFVKYIQKR